MELITNLGATILTPVLLMIIGYYVKRSFDKMEKRGEERIRENIVTMRYLQSIGTLTYVTGKAVRDGRVNGEMSEALDEFDVRREELEDFLLTAASEKKVRG